MNIEVTRGRSEIYDILTHLTFLFIESHKIKNRVLVGSGRKLIREWKLLEEIVLSNKKLNQKECEVTIAHLGNILGRTFEEVSASYHLFKTKGNPHRFLHIIYWLGHLAIKEVQEDRKREMSVSPL